MKRIITAAVAAMLMLCFTACSTEISTEALPAETPETAEQEEKITEEEITDEPEEIPHLTVGYSENADVLAMLADELGYFAEENIDVELVCTDGEDTLNMLSEGELDICTLNALTALSIDDENISLAVCGALEGELCTALNKNTKGYTSGEIDYLDGKTVACVKNNIGAEIIRCIAEKSEDLTVVFAEFDNAEDVLTAVLRREADAGIVCGMSEYDVRERGAGVAFAVEDFAREYPSAFIAENIERRTADKTAFVAYYRAILRAWMTALTDDDAAVSALTARIGGDEESIYNFVYDGTTEFTLADASEKCAELCEILGRQSDAQINSEAFSEALDECISAYPGFEGFGELKD